MHTALSLSSRNTLHTVHTRLILQCAIDIHTTHGEVYLLETTHGTFRRTGHRESETLGVAVLLVHLEQVTGEEGSLVTTGSGAYLHLHVLGIFRVFGHEGNLDFFFQLGLESLVLCQLFARHLLHVGVALVGQYVLGLLDRVDAVDISLAGIHDVAQVLIFTGQLDISLLVGNDIRVGNQG